MSEQDKAKNSAQQAKGNVKEKVGAATSNEDLEAKGKSDQAKGSLKQAGEKVKDAAKGVG
ncbi:MAG: CsbD family protein [Actinomycetota bacterium]|nr:CsbD family protein [Actinomycetota bacterium]